MSRRDDDHIGHVPKMTPAHDEVASFARNQAKGSLASSLGAVPEVRSGQATPVVMKTVLSLVVLVLLLTAGLSGFLYQQLQAADKSLQQYELRISELERQLMVTDESMSESGVAMKVKIREMDSEIRKLWDNVWKKQKKRLSEHEALLEQYGKSISLSDTFISSARQQMSKSESVVAGLSGELKKTQKFHSQVAENQLMLGQLEKAMEFTADKSNRAGNDIIKLDRRIKETEDWIESINGFRRQVNRDLGDIKQNVGQLQGAQ
jgi:predicted  nucleic acid-binding Zn-ribbon protein